MGYPRNDDQKVRCEDQNVGKTTKMKVWKGGFGYRIFNK